MNTKKNVIIIWCIFGVNIYYRLHYIENKNILITIENIQ